MRAVAWLAWSLAGLSVAMFLISVALTVPSLYSGPSTQGPGDWGTAGPLSSLLIFFPFLAFPLVGALIASRRPRNPIGWICLAAGLLWMVLAVTDEYSVYGVDRQGSVTFPVAVGRIGNQWLWVPNVGL